MTVRISSHKQVILIHLLYLFLYADSLIKLRFVN